MEASHSNPYITLSQIFGQDIKTFDDCFEQLKNEHSFERLDNPDCQEALTTIADQKGKTVLVRAIGGCYLPLAERLIEANITLQNTDRNGNTAYHTAAKCGEIEILAKLFNKLNLNQSNAKGHTPLISAIKKGQTDAVKTLVENGADPSKLANYKGLEVSALGFAVLRGELESVRILLKKTSLGEHDTTIGSLLHLAIHFQQNEILQYLITKLPSEHYLETKDTNGNTPFAYAVLVDNPEALSLLKLSGANLEPTNHEKYKPIHLAALHHPHLIESLAFLGCDVKAIGGPGHTLPLHLLDQTKRPEEYNLLCNLTKREQNVELTPPHFGYRPPETLVFKGGGPKGVAYLGALEILEQKRVLPGVIRVAGTSAGAINSTLLALCYTLQETKALLEEKPLLDFIDNPALKDSLDQQSSGAVTGLKVVMRQIFQEIKKCPINFANSPLKTAFSSLYTCTGLCSGDDFQDWIENTIAVKTKINSCTFGELRQLIREGKPYKHLHVFTSNVRTSPPEITHLSSEDSKCDDIVISGAVRASMSIPGVFVPYILHKKINGVSTPCPELGTFLDGGLINNLPIETFDEKQYIVQGVPEEEKRCPMFNKRSLGFSLYTPSDAPPHPLQTESVQDLIKATVAFYTEAETILRQRNPYNQHRIIEISNAGVGLMDFNLTPEQRENLLASGREATKTFYANHDGETRSLFYYPRLEKQLQNAIHLKNPHPHFIARETELRKIGQNLTEQKRTTLYGPGGVGKSELAARYANDHLEEYSLVWTLSCLSTEDRETSYRFLAEALKIPLLKEDKFQDIERRVHHKLEQNRSKPWLLIYDDLNEPINLPARGGHILITSYSKPQNGPSIQVEPFGEQDAETLLTKLTKEEPSDAMTTLIKLCGSYPLVLMRVGTHIGHIPNGTIATYLETYPGLEDLLQLPPEERYQKTLNQVVEQTLETLPEKACSWLLVSSYLHPTEIPQTYLESWIDLAYPGEKKEKRQAKTEILIAVTEHALQSKQENTLKTDRLFHETLKLVETGENLQIASDLLLAQADWNFSLTQNPKEDIERAILWKDQAKHFISHPRFKNLPPRTQATIHYHLGEVRFQTLKYQKAHEHLKKALEIQSHAKSNDTANTLNMIGNCYESQGKYSDALEMHEEALEIYREVLGDRHPDVAISLNHIGGCYESQGKYSEALEKHEEALEIAREVYGDRHPKVATSLNSIGGCYESQGKYREALEKQEVALEIAREVYGDRHPKVAMSLNNIAACYFSQGKYSEALEMFEEALEIAREVYGDRHPKVATSLNNIGGCYFSQGKCSEALEKHEVALEIAREVYGDRHPKVATSLNNIGGCYFSQGKYSEALEKHEVALEIFREVYGDRHPKVAMSLNNIGLCYKSQGKYSEALEKHEVALEIAREVYGDRHPKVATSLNNIGGCYESQGKYSEALEKHEVALEIYREVLGDRHPDVAISLNNIGLCYKSQGKNSEALEKFEEALEIFREVLGDRHPNTSRVKRNIDACLKKKADLQPAFDDSNEKKASESCLVQ